MVKYFFKLEISESIQALFTPLKNKIKQTKTKPKYFTTVKISFLSINYTTRGKLGLRGNPFLRICFIL